MFPSAERQRHFMYHGLNWGVIISASITEEQQLNFVVFSSLRLQ